MTQQVNFRNYSQIVSNPQPAKESGNMKITDEEENYSAEQITLNNQVSHYNEKSKMHRRAAKISFILAMVFSFTIIPALILAGIGVLFKNKGIQSQARAISASKLLLESRVKSEDNSSKIGNLMDQIDNLSLVLREDLNK